MRGALTKFLIASALGMLVIAGFSPIYSMIREFVPPGTVKFTDGYYVDKEEVTNMNWLEYLFWLRTHKDVDPTGYRRSLPDTEVWKNIHPRYVTNYLRDPKFRNYPVVGVTYEQAIEYCKWRTERVREMTRKRKYKTVPSFEYRLPSLAEWIDFSSGTELVEEVELQDGVQKKKEFNYRLSPKDTTYTQPTKSYEPTELGLYNLMGNVAEMVSERGVAVGGSWNHSKRFCSADTTLRYKGEQAWLGFRCICVLKQNN